MKKKYDVRCGDWRAIIEGGKNGLTWDLIANKFEETAKIDTTYSMIMLINEVGNSDISKIIWCTTEFILRWSDFDIYPKNIDACNIDIRIVKKGLERVLGE